MRCISIVTSLLSLACKKTSSVDVDSAPSRGFVVMVNSVGIVGILALIPRMLVVTEVTLNVAFLASAGSPIGDEVATLLTAGLIVDRTEEETVVRVKIGGIREETLGGDSVFGGTVDAAVVVAGANGFEAFVMNSMRFGVSSTWNGGGVANGCRGTLGFKVGKGVVVVDVVVLVVVVGNVGVTVGETVVTGIDVVIGTGIAVVDGGEDGIEAVVSTNVSIVVNRLAIVEAVVVTVVELIDSISAGSGSGT